VVGVVLSEICSPPLVCAFDLGALVEGVIFEDLIGLCFVLLLF